MKYIDADKLRSVLQNTINSMKEKDAKGERYDAFLNGKLSICEELLGCIDSLQQDKETLMLEMCNQSFWEDSGYIMIPPDVTIEGIESLLKQVKKKLQQEQPETDLLEESYMRGFAQGAKEEREGLSPTMMTYAAEVFGGKTLLEDISYSYRQELADYFRDLAKTAQEK